MKHLLACALLATSVSCRSNEATTSASTGATVAAGSVLVSWAKSHEKACNTTGGGYRVYYATSPGFSIATSQSVDVPYVSGAATPTSASLSGLTVGTYYIKVVSYSALNPPGQSGGSTSAPSAEISILVQ